MEEGILVRAVTIGASVLITLATVTAVMLYYNTAKLTVSEVGTGTNIEDEFRNDIKNSLYKSEVTGSELKNILQYFYNDREINITINNYYAYDRTGARFVSIPALERNNVNVDKDAVYVDIMKNMMPNQKFRVVINGNQYSYTVIN